jgi:hypothetical protein
MGGRATEGKAGKPEAERAEMAAAAAGNPDAASVAARLCWTMAANAEAASEPVCSPP